MDFDVRHSFLLKPVINRFGKLFLSHPQEFIKLSYYTYDNEDVFFGVIKQITLSGEYKNEPVTYIRGMVLSPNQLYLILGRTVTSAPYTHSYKTTHEFFKSIPFRSEDYIALETFSKFQNSEIIWNKQSVFSKFSFFNRSVREFINRDIQLPIANAKQFMNFYHKKLAIVPLSIFPSKSTSKEPLLNFAFSNSVQSKKSLTHNYFNRLIEKEVNKLNGNPV